MDVFSTTDYKRYLNERLDLDGRGARAQLSVVVGVQTSYMAQVLRGTAHFSLEQGELINEFFNHSEKESQYFLTLIQSARAGSSALAKRLSRQISSLRQEHLNLKNRLNVAQPLSEHHQIVYYSSWIYGAVHALVSVPGFQTPEVVARELRITVRSASEAIDFLLSCGLLMRDRKHLKIGTARLHLAAESPLVNKHHINWRLRAIQSLEEARGQELHYSSIVSLSAEDAERLHEMLIQTIQKMKSVVRDSVEEDIRAICLDFFKP